MRRRWSPRWVPALFLAVAVPAVIGLQGAVGAPSPSLAAAQKASRYKLPDGFPTPRTPRGNPTTAAKAEIGRRLFYDERLSGNGTQSCSSCHQLDKAFTDGLATAVGSTGEAHPRNTQSLVNVAYEKTLTWANPALVTLERQMAVPLFGTDPVEMGINDTNKDRVLARLKRDPWYRKQLAKAFPGARRPVTYDTIVRSISAFQRTIIAADSRYDRYITGKSTLNESETRGMELFMGEVAECHHCHGSFIFNDQATYVGAPEEPALFHNTGLFNIEGTGAFPAPNRGVFEMTGLPQDMGRFRAPSLRNVALTAPYMHDGSIATLEEVVEHYAGGGRVIAEGPLAGDGRLNPNKDPLVPGIPSLTPQDKADLVSFLRALTDEGVTRDKRFADPFERRK